MAERVKAIVLERVFRIKGIFEQLVNSSGAGASSSAAPGGTNPADSVSATKWLFMKEAESLEKVGNSIIPQNVSGPLPLTVASKFELQLQDASQTLLALEGEAKDGKFKGKESSDQLMDRRFTNVSKTLLSVQKQIKKLETRSKATKNVPHPEITKPISNSWSSGRRRVCGECWDCSSLSHLRGDRSCPNPSERTKKTWAEEELNPKKS
jgi:hypothetical protein